MTVIFYKSNRSHSAKIPKRAKCMFGIKVRISQSLAESTDMWTMWQLELFLLITVRYRNTAVVDGLSHKTFKQAKYSQWASLSRTALTFHYFGFVNGFLKCQHIKYADLLRAVLIGSSNVQFNERILLQFSNIFTSDFLRLKTFLYESGST